MKHCFALIITSIFVMFFSGCTKDENLAQKPTLIGPGFLDMPLLEGSSILENCIVENGFNDTSLLNNTSSHDACVIYPISWGVDNPDAKLEVGYLGALFEIGWNFDGNTGIAPGSFYLEKPLENTDCSESLVVYTRFSPPNQAITILKNEGYGQIIHAGMFLFSKHSDPKCGDERRIK